MSRKQLFMKIQQDAWINQQFQNKSNQINKYLYYKFEVQPNMEHYIMSTPLQNYSLKKQPYTASSPLKLEDCPYCEMKRKFNIGSSLEQRCLQHSITINEDSLQTQRNQETNNQYLTAEEMIELLEEVQVNLDYYWDNLRQVSGGNPNFIHKQLEPVLSRVKRVQQKIGRFFYESTIEVSEIKPISTQTTFNRKYHNTGSQKFLRAELSNIFDPEQSSTQSIKQWVMHFHKIIQFRQAPETTELLPFEQDLEMRIFKQTMQRKFIAFAHQISKYENKVKDVLTKLIFYMEKSSDNVSEKQIEEDILFIEGQQGHLQRRENQVQKLIERQPTSMEHMLGLI